MKRREHITNTALADAQSAKPIILPIFGKNFEGHGVTYPNAQATRFAGEGEEGWGSHAMGTVDCINITKTRWWRMGFEDGWDTFFGMEALPEEMGLPNPAQAVIARLVVTIHLVGSQIVFVPDPHMWAVYTAYSDTPVSGIYGTMCPRPAYDKYQVAFRRKMALRRKSILENCL